MMAVSFRLACLFVLITSQASAQTPNCDNSKGNYTINSTYHKNLNTLLSSFSSHTGINYGFYNFSYGQNADRVYAIGLCTGDLNTDECLRCLNESRVALPPTCPNKKEAIVWNEKCTLQYSNANILGIMINQPTLCWSNMNNATDATQFIAAVNNLMTNLKGDAAAGDSRRKYAADNTTANFHTIYGLVQCTPDLSSDECNRCLNQAISEISVCSTGKVGGQVLKPSCRIRYETYRFSDTTLKLDSYPPTSTPSLPSPPSNNNTSSQGNSNTSRIIIATLVPVASVVLVLSFLCIYRRVRKPRTKIEIKGEEDNHENEISMPESLQFNFDTIRVATDGFSDSNKLGQGGFGPVYRGRLSNGQVIAVKRLSMDSGQGDAEFKNEVLLVAKLQHRNLVRLLGFCLEGRERLLVYEFVLNKSLDYFIFDPIKKAQLDWQKRYKIIAGIARGLLYLHEDSQLRIIHRDLKASNILLNEEMHAKISDFGMARLVLVDQTQENTNKIVGTYGYMAPEYAVYGQFSVKSDVYSFGVLVLEIVSGQKNSGMCHGENVEDLPSFAWRNWREGTVTNIADPTLNGGSQNEIMRCIHIGLLSVQENVAARPTMGSVVLMLNSYSLILPVPSKPAFVMDSRTESAKKSTQNSVNEASITELYPR